MINKELYERYKKMKAEGINITLAELKAQMENESSSEQVNSSDTQYINQSQDYQQQEYQPQTPQQGYQTAYQPQNSYYQAPEQSADTQTEPVSQTYSNDTAYYNPVQPENSAYTQQNSYSTNYSNQPYSTSVQTQTSEVEKTPYRGNMHVLDNGYVQNSSYMSQFVQHSQDPMQYAQARSVELPFQTNIPQEVYNVEQKPATKFGLLGYPLGHSLSTYIHEAGFKSLGLDYTYEILETPPDSLVDRIKYLKTNNYAGFNVTIPLKLPVTMFLDEVDVSADIVGAVNTVVINPDKTMKGYNTDVIGFRNAIPSDFILSGKTVGVLGTGGAARAALTALAASSVKSIKIYTRNIPNSLELLNFLRSKFPTVEFNAYQIEYIRDLSDVELLVNCTPIGMLGRAADMTPVEENELKTLPQGAIVYDVIYNPKKTLLLKLAQKNGYRTINGVDMFICQALEAQKIWTGKTPDFKDMKIAALENL